MFYKNDRYVQAAIKDRTEAGFLLSEKLKNAKYK
jgi:hypothetical protein